MNHGRTGGGRGFTHRPPSGYSGGRHQQDPKLLDLWPNYLRGGFLDAEGNLRGEYVDRRRLEPLVKAMSNARPALTMHQARRFFQHCRSIEARLRSKKSSWREEEANFRKLDIAAADAFGKAQTKIPEAFHDLIRQAVAAVHNQDDFLKGLIPHFEALIGFGGQYFRDQPRS